MDDLCVVVAVDGQGVTVTPFSKEACAACSAECAHRATSFAVANPRGLSLAPGMVVRVTSPKKAVALQGVLSLVVPFACALGGYALAPRLAAAFGRVAGDGFRAVCVLAFLAVAAGAVLLVTRRLPLPGTPQVSEVLPSV